MEYKWLNKENNNKIIIFFNGWGMDESIVKHLNPDNYDILMFYDYNNPETSFDFNTLNIYNQKHIISWSMGVMCATLFSDKLGTIESSTAINGTLKPIDNEYGIPDRIYNLTIRGFSPEGKEKFIQNMFTNPVELPIISRNFENQKSELIALKNYEANKDFKYKKVLLSDNDKIIPTKNQIKYWNIEPNLKSGHCPFYLFKSWGEML